MNNLKYRNLLSRDARVTLFCTFAILLVAVLGCGGGTDGKSVSSEYYGAWTGADGSTLTIRSDGTGDYKSGGTTVDGGKVSINEADNTLSIAFFGIGPSMKIDKAPSGNQMTLGGIVYKKNGGSDSKPDKTSSSKSGDTSDGSLPSDDELQSLVKTTVMNFNDAIQSGDFSDFHSKMSEPFQKQASAEKLKGVFNQFIEAKVNFREVKDMDASFSPSPAVDKSGSYKVLTAKGQYATTPRKTNFTLKYILEDGSWKLSSIEINTKDQ